MLDDFLISPMKDAERRDLLEVLEDRYDRSATVITSQVLTMDWYEMIDDPTVADAICDRLVHNAHVLSLKGASTRQRKALKDRRRENHHHLTTDPSLRSDQAPEQAPGSRRNSCPG
ncbi:MAG: hypothetical protein RLZZ450_7532 [Pseudomonadota bacterium]